MLLKLLFSTVICAFIGWITNFIAIKMLFHPRTPVQIGSLTIQGIFPKRQKALALNLAHAQGMVTNVVGALCQRRQCGG